MLRGLSAVVFCVAAPAVFAVAAVTLGRAEVGVTEAPKKVEEEAAAHVAPDAARKGRRRRTLHLGGLFELAAGSLKLFE